jgi:hypothetical protein
MPAHFIEVFCTLGIVVVVVVCCCNDAVDDGLVSVEVIVIPRIKLVNYRDFFLVFGSFFSGWADKNKTITGILLCFIVRLDSPIV